MDPKNCTPGKSTPSCGISELAGELPKPQNPTFDDPVIDVHVGMYVVPRKLHINLYTYIDIGIIHDVNDQILKTDILEFLVKSPASSGIPQEGVDFPGVQFLGSTSRQKPSYRHPRARVPMLSMVEYSCTVQLFRTAVLCHVINRSVTSSDTSS